jgi:ribosomal protein S18 acetylase RimI-like enzyme
MNTPVIRSASAADEAGVISVITLAFGGDPMARWSMRDPARFLAAMPDVVRAFGGAGFAHDSVYCTEGCTAAAMWLPPGVGPDSERLGELITGAAPPEIMPDLERVFAEMERFHPSEPHWYLPLIGVDPASQGQGLGSALMRHALQRVDADGMPAYLESSNPRNIPLYQRHGFEILGTIQVGSSPQLVPMRRPPRAGHS